MASIRVIFLSLLSVAAILADIPIPRRPLGFVYKNGSPSAPVHFDFYLDQICPDSKAAWPTILKLADSYGPETLKLTVHLFPLPYHRNSFYASKGTHIVDMVSNGSKSYDWVQIIFDKQVTLTNDATLYMADKDIIQMFAGIAHDSLGISESLFSSMLLNRTIELDTRLGWKYCCTRGITGTPTFFVNDIVVEGDPTWSVSDWRAVIDPLLKMDTVQSNNNKVKVTACKPGTTRCQYLPGKVQCCTKGENCIPNVGCRC